ncbi:MAG: glycosyltransferase [Rhizomicrobium sp.]
MRVVHFAETLIGGPATHLNQLLPFQVRAYDEVSVFCPQRHGHLIECAGVRVCLFPDTQRTIKGFAELYRHWRQHMLENSYDIVHLHSSFAGAVGRLQFAQSETPIIYCSRGWSFAMDNSASRKRFYGFAERLLSYRADAIINISRNEDALAAWAGVPRDKCRMIYNGIHDAPWTPIEERREPKRLLFVGRYDRQKGIDQLLEAMETLSRHGFALETIGGQVVGKPLVDKFPDYIVNRGWQNASEVQKAMGAADIIVVPSRWEGFGFVAVEAMRAGRPLVVSNVGGLSEIVVDGETGVLCAPNSSDAIIEGVLRLSKMNVRQLGINGRKRFEMLFTAERMFNEIDRTYRDVLGSRGLLATTGHVSQTTRMECSS